MKKSTRYTGINIQFPISRLILSGEKTIETRRYPVPARYVGEKLVIIEAPGKLGKFKAQMVGFVIFGKSFQYRSENEFYRDTKSHRVSRGSPWQWKDGERKFGWPILSISVFKSPKPLQKRSGIIYSKDIQI